jgi:hypothetical protein
MMHGTMNLKFKQIKLVDQRVKGPTIRKENNGHWHYLTGKAIDCLLIDKHPEPISSQARNIICLT